MALFEHRREAARGDEDIRKIARLNIGERVELPSAAPDEAQARFLSLARRIGALEAPGAAIVERPRARQQFDRIGERGDEADLRRTAVIGAAGGGGGGRGGGGGVWEGKGGGKGERGGE